MDQKYGSGIDNNAHTNFNKQLEKLKNLFETHAGGLEEKEVFPLLEARLATEDLESLNNWFERIKGMAPTRPHPDGPQSATGQLLVGMLKNY